MRKEFVFSLPEVTSAIGIIAFELIAILLLLPVGTRSGAEAIDDTRTALIGKDVQARVKASVTYTMFSNTSDVSLPTWFYDREGDFLGTAVSATALYRIDAVIHGDWGTTALVNIDKAVMRPITVQIKWPVNPSNGNALGKNAKSFTFYVRRP